MRVASATVQLVLPDPVLADDPADRWWSLPEQTRGHVMGLLAALIARGVLIGPDVTSVDLAGSTTVAGEVDDE
jgi:hypothetical protein